MSGDKHKLAFCTTGPDKRWTRDERPGPRRATRRAARDGRARRGPASGRPQDPDDRIPTRSALAAPPLALRPGPCTPTPLARTESPSFPFALTRRAALSVYALFLFFALCGTVRVIDLEMTVCATARLPSAVGRSGTLFKTCVHDEAAAAGRRGPHPAWPRPARSRCDRLWPGPLRTTAAHGTRAHRTARALSASRRTPARRGATPDTRRDLKRVPIRGPGHTPLRH